VVLAQEVVRHFNSVGDDRSIDLCAVDGG
jgi:hypothetical protein